MTNIPSPQQVKHRCPVKVDKRQSPPPPPTHDRCRTWGALICKRHCPPPEGQRRSRRSAPPDPDRSRRPWRPQLSASLPASWHPTLTFPRAASSGPTPEALKLPKAPGPQKWLTPCWRGPYSVSTTVASTPLALSRCGFPPSTCHVREPTWRKRSRRRTELPSERSGAGALLLEELR